MRQIQDSLKTDPVFNTSLTRSYKAKQIQNRLKPDLAMNFIELQA